MNGVAGDISCFWRWYIVLPVILRHMVLPAAAFSFFCRYCGNRCGVFVKRIWCAGYVALSVGLSIAEYKFDLKGSPGLVLETVLLACCGKIPGKRKWPETFAVSVLILSMFSVVNGIISWADHRIFAPVIVTHESLVYPSDGAREFLKVLGFMALFGAVLSWFGRVMEDGDERTLGWMIAPIFFIAMVERIIQNSIYGDNIVMDGVSGEMSSIVDINHGEMLLLQIFACFCLFLALFAYEKIIRIIRETERFKMQKQQAGAQEIYVREAAMRYERTQAFRHDIKNHLAVLEKLLRDNQAREAWEYLWQLEEMAEELSWNISTGNAAVDALLGSKLALAEQEGIETECDMRLSEDSGIKDVDWCIVLSNGVDNAIKACRDVEAGRQYLKIEGKRKGNLYLIFMENSCRQDMEEVPKDGTGLSNIRAAAKRYDGRVENEVSGGRYRLKVLLVDSQQKKGD